MSGALERLQAVYATRDLAARAWKAGGGKVVGILGHAPEALIMAAGLLPYRLSGDPDADLGPLRTYLYPLFNKAQSVRGLIAREQPNTILAQLFGGRLDFLDYLVVSAGRKDLSQALTHLQTAKATYPELKLPEVHYLDRTSTASFAGSVFNRAQLEKLIAQLEAWTGAPLGREALQAARAEWNAWRHGLDGVTELRREGRISGVEALTAFGAGWLMPKAEHARLAEALADARAEATPATGATLLVVGGDIDRPDLHAVLEDQGARVVGDGHGWGESALPPPITTDLPPFEAIAEQWEATHGPVTVPLADTAAALVQTAREAGAEGVVLLTWRDDPLAAFDAPDLVAAFERAGLPVLHLADQPYALDRAKASEQAQAFLRGLSAARA